jgi:SpoVK/Ycf46/Vps4 family AAA+-type ATPase
MAMDVEGPSPQLLAALEAALATDPDNHDVRAHLADLLCQAGDPASALENAARVLQALPDHVEALRVVAEASAVLAELARPDDDDDLLVPDTADELMAEWEATEALLEPDVGTLVRPGIRLEDVGGLDDVKARLDRSFLKPLRNPELREQFGKRLRGGLLLWGPPGCGKTFIARAIAGELGANFYAVGLAQVLDMWVGNSERNIASVFDVAREHAPCVLFFDEIDALGRKRSQIGPGSGAMRGVVNQLLSEMDGIGPTNDGVFLLAASNHPWDVDSALLRPGRFDRMLLVLPPDRPAREAILRTHLRGRPQADLDLARIAKRTDGWSGADLALICEQATESAMDASLEAGEVRPITQADLDQAAGSVRPSIKSWMETAKNYATFSNGDGAYDDLAAYLSGRRR